MTEATTLERDIAAAVSAARIRLRFDRVVIGLVARLKAALDDVVPQDQSIVFTLTAPIRLPAKTAAAIEALVRDDLDGRDIRTTLHGNHVRLRRVAGVSAAMPRVAGFVHNQPSDGEHILDLAQARLLERK